MANKHLKICNEQQKKQYLSKRCKIPKRHYNKAKYPLYPLFLWFMYTGRMDFSMFRWECCVLCIRLNWFKIFSKFLVFFFRLPIQNGILILWIKETNEGSLWTTDGTQEETSVVEDYFFVIFFLEEFLQH